MDLTKDNSYSKVCHLAFTIESLCIVSSEEDFWDKFFSIWINTYSRS